MSVELRESKSHKSFVVGCLLFCILAATIGTARADSFDPVGGNTIAVWRPSTGTWFVLNHATGAIRVQQWGQEGDIPVAADYDGDGTTAPKTAQEEHKDSSVQELKSLGC